MFRNTLLAMEQKIPTTCRSLIFSVLSICCGCIPSMAQDTIRLSLNNAIETALGNNTELVISEKQVTIARHYRQEIKGGFLPKLTVSGNYTRNIDKQVIFLPEGIGSGPTKIGSDNSFTSSLDMSVPVYSWTTSANKEYAVTNLGLQQETLRGTRQTTVVNIKKNYFNYVVAIAAVEVRKKGVRNALENLRNTEDRLTKGIATEFDRTSAIVKLTTAKNNLLEAETSLVPLANKLKILLGLPITMNISPTDSLTVGLEELLAGEDLANLLSNNSNEKQMELKAVMARKQSKITRANYFPTLTAVGSYQIQSQENDFKFSQYSWVNTSYVGLKLSLQLFNGTVTSNKFQQAILSEEIARKQLQLAIENDRAQYQQLLSQLDYATQRISLQEENVHLSENAIELAKERYQYGKGTFLELSNAELDYTMSRLNYLQAVLDYKSAYFDYELLIGKEN